MNSNMKYKFINYVLVFKKLIRNDINFKYQVLELQNNYLENNVFLMS
jgi:hypothetical protein